MRAWWCGGERILHFEGDHLVGLVADNQHVYFAAGTHVYQLRTHDHTIAAMWSFEENVQALAWSEDLYVLTPGSVRYLGGQGTRWPTTVRDAYGMCSDGSSLYLLRPDRVTRIDVGGAHAERDLALVDTPRMCAGSRGNAYVTTGYRNAPTDSCHVLKLGADGGEETLASEPVVDLSGIVIAEYETSVVYYAGYDVLGRINL